MLHKGLCGVLQGVERRGWCDMTNNLPACNPRGCGPCGVWMGDLRPPPPQPLRSWTPVFQVKPTDLNAEMDLLVYACESFANEAILFWLIL